MLTLTEHYRLMARRVVGNNPIDIISLLTVQRKGSMGDFFLPLTDDA
jgi:hypothetical protein